MHFIMRLIKIHLDMDMTIADFITEYLNYAQSIGVELNYPLNDNTKNPDLFKKAVLEHGIFEKLEPLDGAAELRELLEKLEFSNLISVELLTSLNSIDKSIMQSGMEQKNKWLQKHGFNWKVNFVSACHEKAAFANPYTILIDDSPKCVNPYIQAGGSAILFTKYDDNFKKELSSLIEQLSDSINVLGTI